MFTRFTYLTYLTYLNFPTDVKNLEEDIFVYAKKNLAVVNVYIKDPVVTRIMRDQKIPIIAFVANTGGLLGNDRLG